jgi:uncharacterized protein
MKSLLCLVFCFSIVNAIGQSKDLPTRFIEVSGEGEVKVDPNIIYLSIQLQEFKKDGKIVKLETLESNLKQVLQTVGIASENLKVYATSGRQYDLKKIKSNLMIGKRYSLKLEDVDLFNPLLEALAEVDILSVNVREVTHTEIEKHKAEAKVKAINAAKDKAVLLTSTVGTKVGDVLQIREQPVQSSAAGQPGTSSLYFRGVSQYDDHSGKYPGANNVAFEQITLAYKVIVMFALQ